MIMQTLEEKLLLQSLEKEKISEEINQIIEKYGLKIDSILDCDTISWYISNIQYYNNILYFFVTNQYWTKQYIFENQQIEKSDIRSLSKLVNANVTLLVNEENIHWIKINALTNNDDFIKNNAIQLSEKEQQRKYKYIHYRQEGVFNAMKERENIIKQIREYFSKNDFIEIETPILWPIFSEYADESFLVEDKNIWWYYSLPQSPQVYKQLCILSWVQKYFQIARCFRRDADSEFKKIEFTQMDVEVSNKNSTEIREILENLVKQLFRSKWIDLPWNIPVFTYEEAIQKFWTEKPILEWEEYSLCWVINSPIFELENGKIQPSHHVVSQPLKEDIHLLETTPLEVRWDNYDLIFNGQEVAWWDIRIHDALLQYKMLKLIWYDDKYIEKYYSWYLEALSNGCPPHWWFATWIERIVTLLNKNNDISKYIMFPKYANGEPISWFPK